MGSDSSPRVLFAGAQLAAEQLDPSCTLVVIGTHSVIRELRQHSHIASNHAQIEFHAVADAIVMADDPLAAASRKKSSSLVVGVRLLKKRYLDAFISAGNTGALITSATLQLPRLPGIKRPALLAVLPTVTGSVAVLDVGGSVMFKPHHLVQFAQMGAAYQRCMEGIESPNVALLNIGVEPKKGNSVVRQAYQQLEQMCQKDSSMHFVGNVEGRELFQGGVDVLVTDGFTGNVLLKTSEGVSSFIFGYLNEALQGAPSDKLLPAFQELKRYFTYTEYPGAFVCGVEGILIKNHGNASAQSIVSSIKGAKKLIDTQIISNLYHSLNKIDNNCV